MLKLILLLLLCIINYSIINGIESEDLIKTVSANKTELDSIISKNDPRLKGKYSCFTDSGIPGFCNPSNETCSEGKFNSSVDCNDKDIECCPFEMEKIKLFDNIPDCGMRPDISAIVGGFDAEPNTWPWTVAIYRKSGANQAYFICGGSILSKNLILTASHCLMNNYGTPAKPDDFLVKVGAHSLSTHKIFLKVSQIIPHPNYNDNLRYFDIGLIVVKYPIEFNPTVSPVCLPASNVENLNLVGSMAKVIGWGAPYFGGPTSDTLQEVDLPIVTNFDCSINYSKLGFNQLGFPYGINKQFICAGFRRGEKDSCQGDSGGPLLLQLNNKWVTIGIVSFGYGCAKPGFPGIYTRVTTFLPWINKYMNIYS